MIKVSFEGHSDSEESIDKIRIKVEDLFQTRYPESEGKIVRKERKNLE